MGNYFADIQDLCLNSHLGFSEFNEKNDNVVPRVSLIIPPSRNAGNEVGKTRGKKAAGEDFLGNLLLTLDNTFLAF